jgi:signal transduction histidine kinase
LYELSADRCLEGGSIDLSTCPSYAAALRTFRAVAAHDACQDPRTRELEPYLRRHGITSLLDSPIFQQGKPIGIVCHEHTGAARTWSKEDTHFAATVSDMLGLYVEQAEVQKAYDSLVEMQAELERSRVMESLGRVAAAVAHDFNNVLTAISMRSDLRQLPSDGAAARGRYAEDMRALVEQGARLVRQLLSVARRESSTQAAVDVGAVLRDMQSFLETLEPEGVSVEVNLPREQLLVRLEQSQLEQIITNLAVNARDAMLGGGTLTIELARVRGEDTARELIRLRVADTGVGMDEHTRTRIFEPFFTTKRAGEGVGLGLATVYRLVESSGGSVRVRSAPGEGTEFVIDWPLMR